MSLVDLDERWWAELAKGKLCFQRCQARGSAVFYPRVACPACFSGELEWSTSKGTGVIYAMTTVHRPPRPSLAVEAPYPVLLVDLDEGFRMLARGLDPSAAMCIGVRARAVIKATTRERPSICFVADG